MSNAFFPQRPAATPSIYAYEDTNPQYKGLLKIGFTTKSVQDRVAQQYPTIRPGALPYRIVLEESAMRSDGSTFIDHDVHRYLRQVGVRNPDGEWFQCNVDKIKVAVVAIRNRELEEESRTLDFCMRPEQEEAVKKTIAYFKSFKREIPRKTPHFLWNAKMRFGKTFASYQLAKRMGWSKVLILTFKPAVQSAWQEDLASHVDFKGWQFIARNHLSYNEVKKNRPFVCFASFQDFLGRNDAGGIKLKNEWAHSINWDCVIFDEYHYGA
jgi:superfamily II DNA or RNA helicase